MRQPRLCRRVYFGAVVESGDSGKHGVRRLLVLMAGVAWQNTDYNSPAVPVKSQTSGTGLLGARLSSRGRLFLIATVQTIRNCSAITVAISKTLRTCNPGHAGAFLN